MGGGKLDVARVAKRVQYAYQVGLKNSRHGAVASDRTAEVASNRPRISNGVPTYQARVRSVSPHSRAPATMPASVRPGWGVLVAVGDKAKAAAHFDRSLDRKADVSAAALTGGDLDLCTTKTILGRLLMNAEGTARAASQVADILIDVPSGA